VEFHLTCVTSLRRLYQAHFKIGLRGCVENGRDWEKMDPFEVIHLRCMGTIGFKRLIGTLESLNRILSM
jgi:hypothetical protein